jgi:hypothetical protein
MWFIINETLQFLIDIYFAICLNYLFIACVLVKFPHMNIDINWKVSKFIY